MITFTQTDHNTHKPTAAIAIYTLTHSLTMVIDDSCFSHLCLV